MKKLLSILAVLVIGLAACGGDSSESSSETSSESSSETTSEAKTYKGEQVTEGDDGSKTTTTVEYTIEGDDITAVTINAEKDGVDKRTDEYGMVGDNGLTWGEQADAIQDYIVENDAAPTADAEGSVADSVSSATIGAGDIISAFNNATEQ